MHTLVLLRHGESTWNKENRFTGWTDVDLSDRGVSEAHDAASMLKAENLLPEIAFTSVLKRAIRTLWIVLDDLNRMWIPVYRHWRLNERHYGALQGLNKTETAARHGEEQVKLWRRSYDIPPPALDINDTRFSGRDPIYQGIDWNILPRAESLKDTVERFMPYWHDVISPVIITGKRVIIAAHGNSLRALVKYLDTISEEEIVELNIPTGIPLVYELDENLRKKSSRYLGDPEEIKKKMAAVAAQGKAKQ